MAKTRALRRAAREADRAARISQARERNQQRQRREARVALWRDRLLPAAPPGSLARARRRRARVLIFLGILLNVLIWALSPSVAVRGFAFVVTLLIAPMLAVLIVGRSR